MVTTVKNDKPVEISLDWRKLNDSCIKIRPHMTSMEEVLNQVSAEIQRDRTQKLMISKIGLDYTYGQMRLPKEINRQGVFGLTGRKFSVYYRFKGDFTVLPILQRYSKKKFTNPSCFYTIPRGVDTKLTKRELIRTGKQGNLLKTIGIIHR